MPHPKLVALAGTALAVLSAGPVLAGPVLCTTTLEAPLVGGGGGSPPAAPVEVTRCGALQTAPELMVRRFYSYTAPYARGVDLTHQITDILGIAMGGGDGTKVMGFGFPDQTIVWDGSAVENTAAVMLEDQSDPMPLRTLDLPGVFGGSLSVGGSGTGDARSIGSPTPSPILWNSGRRGLW